MAARLPNGAVAVRDGVLLRRAGPEDLPAIDELTAIRYRATQGLRAG